MSEASPYDETLGAIGEFIVTATDLTRRQLFFLQLSHKLISEEAYRSMNAAIETEISDNIDALRTSIGGLKQISRQPQIAIQHPSRPEVGILQGVGFNTQTGNFTADIGEETTWPLLDSAQLSLAPITRGPAVLPLTSVRKQPGHVLNNASLTMAAAYRWPAA